MLKKRILTAVVLIPIVVWLVLLAPELYFIAGLMLLYLLSWWEWTKLSGISEVVTRLSVTLGMSAVTVAISSGAFNLLRDQQLWIFGASAALWTVALVILAFDSYLTKLKEHLKTTWIGVAVGAWVLLPMYYGILVLRRVDPWLLQILLILVWTADSAAYAFGKKWGQTLLAPAVSPGKTWEGVMGAFMVTLPLSVIIAIIFGWHLYGFVALSAVAVAFSIVGDLWESLFKRLHDLKDSGKILMGHGGILDRIDGLTSAVPIFTFGYILLKASLMVY